MDGQHKLFDSLYGNNLTRFHTEQLWSTQVYKAINTNNENQFKENLEELLKWTEYPDYAEYSNWMHWYQTQKNWNALANLFDEHCKTAKASAEKSIELGIAAKEDVKKTQEFLAEIRAVRTKKDAKKSKK